MLKQKLRTLRRYLGMTWHARRHILRIALRAIQQHRKRGAMVFIDLGAADGDTAAQALSLWPKLNRLILLEPGQRRFDILKKRFENDARIELLRTAAGTENIESARLYHERRMNDGRFFEGQGDSLLSAKRNIDPDDYENVQVVDFAEYLFEHTQFNDYIFLKVDIEGGEYDLLESMCRKGAIERVSRLYCEWHGEKINIPAARHFALVNALQSRGFAVTGINRYDEFRLRRRENS